jgi:glutaminyl-tRNA synthetase
VLDPLLVVLAKDSFTEISVPDFPFDPSRGSHKVVMGSEIYIDRQDFRLEDSEDYFGLAPDKSVTLKYAFNIRCDTVELAADGSVQRLLCSVISSDAKPKGTIHWVDKATAVGAEVRMYEPLFTVEEPSDDGWEEELNRHSEVVVQALLDPHILSHAPQPEMHFQFERIGFFVTDKDSASVGQTIGKSSIEGITPTGLVFNSTVSLKDSKPKVAGTGKSRKDEQARQLAEKMARMNISPEELFKSQTHLYSAFDVDGVPTHDAAGEKLSKSAVKNLRKEWEKQKKLFEKHTAAAT